MPGRIWCLFLSMVGEGIFCILLGAVTVTMPVADIAQSNTAGLCVLLLSTFSLFVQMAEGGTYSIVPQAPHA
eukprot:1048253-Prymnesium_polylepis.1